MKTVLIKNIPIGNNNPLVLIAGPCVIEDEKTTLIIAEKLKEISIKYDINLIFKSSYEKDNRSSVNGYRGPGIISGLEILQKVKNEFKIPVISDVHRMTDVDLCSEVLDIIQIPAFLSQQTSLLLKVASSGKPINIKKGQFTAPKNMSNSINKILSNGNDQILLTERGSCFGYNYLVSDMTSIPVMQNLGYPVIFDATHIVRVYGIPSENPQGGNPQFIFHLTRAAVAAGCDGIFLETHIDLSRALCDASSMLDIYKLPELLETVIPISKIIRALPLKDGQSLNEDKGRRISPNNEN